MLKILARRLKKYSIMQIKKKALFSVVKFLVKFNLLAIPLYIVLALNIDFYWLERMTAEIVFLLLKIIGLNPAISNIVITIPVENGTWAAVINSACTGWKSAYLFFALVAATPYSLRSRAWEMVFLPLIMAANIARIVFMFWVASTNLSYFEVVHAVVWAWGMALLVVGLWALWLCKRKFFENLNIPPKQ